MTRIGLMTLGLLISWIAFAQKASIRIVNAETGEVFSRVHYKYGELEGTSDDNGMIVFQIKEGNHLTISHISLGKRFFTDDEVKKAVLSGELRLKPGLRILLPAVVLARKSMINNNLQVNETDKVTHDAAAFLNQVPLISSIKKGGNYGFDPVLRGFKYDQLNLVMDGGLCATAACPNRMDPPSSQIPMNMIESIEILKGPYSLRYGLGFGGTINFKSQANSYSKKNDLRGRISAGYDGNGSIHKTEGNIAVTGSYYDISIYGSYSDGNDYHDGNDSIVQAAFNRLNLGTRMRFRINRRNEVSFSLAHNYASDVDFPALNMDLRKDNTWLTHLSHKYRSFDGVFKSLETSVFGSWVDHEMDNYNKIVIPRKVDAVTYAETQNMGLRSEALFATERWQLFTGLDFKDQNADGDRFRTLLMGPKSGTVFQDNVWQDSKVSEASVFGEYRYHMKQGALISSIRLNFNDAMAFDADDRFRLANEMLEATQVNPSVSLGYITDVSNALSLGIWMGRAQRSGSLTERYINFLPVGRDPYERVGNASLNPEINHQMDLDLKWQTASANIEVNVFGAYLNDYISSEINSELTPLMSTAPGVKQYMNIGNAFLAGTEVNWGHRWNGVLYSNFSMAYTYGENLEDNSPLPEIAPLDSRFLVGANLIREKLKPEVSLRLVSKQSRVAKSFGETTSPGFRVMDVMLNYVPISNMSIKAGIANVFNTAYYEHLSRSVKGNAAYRVYNPGRSLYATVSYQF